MLTQWSSAARCSRVLTELHRIPSLPLSNSRSDCFFCHHGFLHLALSEHHICFFLPNIKSLAAKPVPLRSALDHATSSHADPPIVRRKSKFSLAQLSQLSLLRRLFGIPQYAGSPSLPSWHSAEEAGRKQESQWNQNGALTGGRAELAVVGDMVIQDHIAWAGSCRTSCGWGASNRAYTASFIRIQTESNCLFMWHK
jgi:hypothetical protein